MRLTIDFETRSRVDLKKAGMYAYAADPSTDVLCLAVKVDEEEPALWLPAWVQEKGLPRTLNARAVTDTELRRFLEQATEIEAHNAGFERCIWREIMHRRYGFPDLPLTKMRCSAAKAAAFSLPRSLGEACRVLGVSQQKDNDGYRVMLKMCKPRKPTKYDAREWHEDPADFEKLALYCLQDTKAEHELSRRLPPLPPKEQRIWEIDQVINDRGLAVDLDSIRKLIDKVEAKEDRLLLEIQEITGGRVKSVRQRNATLDWLADQDVLLENLRKQAVEEALRLGLSDDKARRLLEIRQSLGKASVSKLDTMRRMAGSDGRVRGALLFNGAATGRWAGKGLQVHNYPRESFKEHEVNDFVSLDTEMAEMLYGCVIQNASKCLRGMIFAPPGKTLVAADFNAIEARVLAWLAGEEKTLTAFRTGKDPYKVAAADIYRVRYDDVTDDQRQVGKVAVLALGYQGWLGAFETMAQAYGVKIDGDAEAIAKARSDAEAIAKLPANDYAEWLGEATLEQKKRVEEPEVWAREERLKEIILNWRQGNQNIVQLWAGLEAAALQAVRTGKAFAYGRIKYGMRNGFLHCRLPSGRLLTYPHPFVKTVKTKYGQTKEVLGYFGVDSKGHWGELAAYGGLLCENVIQAISRDILAEALVRLEDHGFPTVLHVHDEVVCERPEGDERLDEFEKLMAVVPAWAEGLPLKAKGYVGKRYRKG